MKIANDNLSNNKVASDNFSQNTLVSFNADFNGLEKTIGLFIPSVRNVMIERYRVETFLKIGLKASEITERLGLKTQPIPPKAALPLFEKLSLESEENMYDLWAKLLVDNSVNPDSIHIQYAEILSKISSNEAIALKFLYDNTKTNFPEQWNAMILEKTNCIVTKETMLLRKTSLLLSCLNLVSVKEDRATITISLTPFGQSFVATFEKYNTLN